MPGALNTSPKVNWVEKHGGLPAFIERVAKHIIEQGRPKDQAIAAAINFAKHVCKTGDVRNFKGVQNVNAGSRAEACAAILKWNAMRAAAKVDNSIPAAEREQIDFAFRHVEQTAAKLRRGVIDFAFNPGQARDKIGRWRALVGKLAEIKVGEKVKVKTVLARPLDDQHSVEIEKVAATGESKYRVTVVKPLDRLPDDLPVGGKMPPAPSVTVSTVADAAACPVRPSLMARCSND